MNYLGASTEVVHFNKNLMVQDFERQLTRHPIKDKAIYNAK